MFQYVISLSINWAVNGSFFLFTNAEKHSGTLTSPCLERLQAALAVIRSRRLVCLITAIWSLWPLDSWNNNRKSVIDESVIELSADEVVYMDSDGDASRLSPCWRLSAGGSAIKRGSDLTQPGLSKGRRYAPVYHALKGGNAAAFEVPDHPAGSLKTCRSWTFMPLAESYSIFIHLLMCIFEG